MKWEPCVKFVVVIDAIVCFAFSNAPMPNLIHTHTHTFPFSNRNDFSGFGFFYFSPFRSIRLTNRLTTMMKKKKNYRNNYIENDKKYNLHNTHTNSSMLTNIERLALAKMGFKL